LVFGGSSLILFRTAHTIKKRILNNIVTRRRFKHGLDATVTVNMFLLKTEVKKSNCLGEILDKRDFIIAYYYQHVKNCEEDKCLC
jgi:hypothetical protein